MKKYLTIFAGALLMAACNNDAEDIAGNSNGYQPSTDAIAFEVEQQGVQNSTTRALGEIYDDAALQTKEIGVFASYTGKLKYENTTVSPDFMWNQRLAYASGEWTYNPVKYWPNTIDGANRVEYVSFFAYAPYEQNPTDDGTKCIIDLSANNVNGDPWLNYRLAKYPWPKDETGADRTPNQVDLLYGTKRIGDTAPYTYEPWTNVTNWNDAKTAKVIGEGQKVKFTMKHALASIGNEIKISISQEMADLIRNYSRIDVTGIKIVYKNLTNKARLVLNSADGSANWKEIISGELTTSRTYVNMFASNIEFDGTKWETGTAVNNYTDGDDANRTEITYLNTTTDVNSGKIGDGLFYIPLQIAGTEKPQAEVTLYYKVWINALNNYIATTPDPAEAKSTIDLNINDMEGKQQGLLLILGKDFDLMHEVWTLGGTATEPSYSRITK